MTKKKIGTGKRIVFTAKSVVEILDWDIFEPERGEVLFESHVTLVSPGTELSRLHDTHTVSRPYPTNTGYASAGKVVRVGPGVDEYKPGDTVLSSLGHVSHNPMPVSNLTPIPEGMDLRDAVWQKLCMISIFGVRRGEVAPGCAVGVFGLGVIGQLAVNLSSLAGGLPVIAVDPVEFRRDKALEMGADAVVDPSSEDVAGRIQELTGGNGLDVIIECTGTPHVAHQMFEYAAYGARVVILGGVHKPVSLDLYSDFQKKCITMVGAHTSGTPAAGTAFYRYSSGFNSSYIFRALGKGVLAPGKLVTHFVPFRKAPEMYAALTDRKDETLGVVFDWSETVEECGGLWE